MPYFATTLRLCLGNRKPAPLTGTCLQSIAAKVSVTSAPGRSLPVEGVGPAAGQDALLMSRRESLAAVNGKKKPSFGRAVTLLTSEGLLDFSVHELCEASIEARSGSLPVTSDVGNCVPIVTHAIKCRGL